MTGLIGAAGGIGDFYLPVVMGLARENTGSCQLRFAVFAALATLALGLVAALHKRWRAWAMPWTLDIPLDEPITE
ncbi:MAG TPA: hypothetical protein VEK10_00375 [Steroidobacteraceae bacterium]|nr:hypothetical protein [Steroidobacteraceae bacterium]